MADAPVGKPGEAMKVEQGLAGFGGAIKAKHVTPLGSIAHDADYVVQMRVLVHRQALTKWGR